MEREIEIVVRGKPNVGKSWVVAMITHALQYYGATVSVENDDKVLKTLPPPQQMVSEFNVKVFEETKSL